MTLPVFVELCWHPMSVQINGSRKLPFAFLVWHLEIRSEILILSVAQQRLQTPVRRSCSAQSFQPRQILDPTERLIPMSNYGPLGHRQYRSCALRNIPSEKSAQPIVLP